MDAGDEVLTWGEISPEFKGHLEQDNAVSRLVSGIILLIVVLGVASAQLAAVLERRREFAVLSALGMRSRTIIAVLLQEALAIGIASAVAGLAARAAVRVDPGHARHRSEPVHGRELQLSGRPDRAGHLRRLRCVDGLVRARGGDRRDRRRIAVSGMVCVEDQSRRRITGGVMSEPILIARGVTKVFELGRQEVRALRGVDLDVREGEFMALVGPSGSGKTTLLNLVGALDVPTSGELVVLGQQIATLSRRERADLRLRSIGFVFQAFNLVPVLTALENVEFVLELQGLEHRRDRARTVLQELGLADLADRRPSELSGGQQQRVAVARAIAARPGAGPRRRADRQPRRRKRRDPHAHDARPAGSARHDLHLLDARSARGGACRSRRHAGRWPRRPRRSHTGRGAARDHPWDWQSTGGSECVTCDGVPASCSSLSRFLH